MRKYVCFLCGTGFCVFVCMNAHIDCDNNIDSLHFMKVLEKSVNNLKLTKLSAIRKPLPILTNTERKPTLL